MPFEEVGRVLQVNANIRERHRLHISKHTHLVDCFPLRSDMQETPKCETEDEACGAVVRCVFEDGTDLDRPKVMEVMYLTIQNMFRVSKWSHLTDRIVQKYVPVHQVHNCT